MTFQIPQRALTALFVPGVQRARQTAIKEEERVSTLLRQKEEGIRPQP